MGTSLPTKAAPFHLNCSNFGKFFPWSRSPSVHSCCGLEGLHALTPPPLTLSYCVFLLSQPPPPDGHMPAITDTFHWSLTHKPFSVSESSHRLSHLFPQFPPHSILQNLMSSPRAAPSDVSQLLSLSLSFVSFRALAVIHVYCNV